MQKILLILCAILTTTSVHATQMCARRDTTVIPLDASVASSKSGASDTLEWMWSAPFDYGTIYGVGTCLSLQELREIEGNQKLSTLVDVLSTEDKDFQGHSDNYVASDGTIYPRQYCYIKLTHPMSSRWIGISDYGSSSTCLSQCNAIGAAAGRWFSVRSVMFLNIGIGYTEIDTNKYGTSISLN